MSSAGKLVSAAPNPYHPSDRSETDCPLKAELPFYIGARKNFGSHGYISTHLSNNVEPSIDFDTARLSKKMHILRGAMGKKGII